MKKIALIALFILVQKAYVFALVAGDIAITGFNFDNPDEFSFVALTTIPNGEIIEFTDNGWQSSGSLRTGEGTITWTNNTGSDISCGTEIVIDATNVTVNIGSVSKTGSFALSSSGDQILAYQGTSSSPTFIFAINSEGTGWQATATSSNTSALPAGLTNGTNAIALNEIDNASYDCSVTSGSGILAAICDPANWLGSNTTRFSLPPNCSFSCIACTPLSEPITPASDLLISNIQCYQADISWTNGDGNNRIVVVSTAPITGTPIDQTAYSANNSFGSGSTIAAGEYVIFNGTSNSTIVLNLNSNTTYYVAVFEYNGTSPNCDENYLTTSVTTSFTTLNNCVCPEIKSILVNACTTAEGTDEYIIYQNGSFDTYVDSLSITFPSAGTWCNNGCGTQTLLENATYINNLNTLAGCPGLFVYSDTIPANAQVIVFTGNPPSYTMDFSSQCGAGPFYAIFANNTNTSGRFANSSNANRTTTISFSSTCSDAVTYYSSSANTGTDGDYVDFDAAGNPYYKNDANCAVPLPIELLAFTVKAINENTAEVTWQTATEINNDYFVIENSIDGLDFIPVAIVKGAGFSNDIINYTQEINYNNRVTNYYRLKQVDFDGNFSYSDIVALNPLSNNNFTINFDNDQNLTVFSERNETITIMLYSLNGKLLFTKKNTTNSNIRIPRLANGIYLVTVESDFSFFRKKLIINR